MIIYISKNKLTTEVFLEYLYEFTRVRKGEPGSLIHHISLHISAGLVAILVWIRWQDIIDGEEVAD